MTKLLNKKEVAQILGLSVGGINKLVMTRRIPFCKLNSSKHAAVRFDPVSIENWIRENTMAVNS